MNPQRLKNNLIFFVPVFSLCILLSAQTAVGYEAYDVTQEVSNLNPSQWKKEPLWIDRAMGKFTFGSFNFFFGWMEIFTEPYEAADLGQNVFLGLARGGFNALFDTLGGALNVLTFPFTTFQVPLPEGGVEVHEF